MQDSGVARPHEQCQLILSSSTASYASPLVAAQKFYLAVVSRSAANLDVPVCRIFLVRGARGA